MEFQKYHKIKTIGDEDNKEIFDNPEDEIIIQEKVDGANFRFFITKDGKIIFGSRTQQLTSDEGENTNIQKNFLRAVNHVRKRLENKEIPHLHNLIFYSECMTRHTLSYDWENTPPIIGFDIYNQTEKEYLDYDEVKKIYDSLEIETVPLVKRCNAKEVKEINDDMVPTSKYNPLVKAEGIIFKNYKKQLFAKYVRQEFREKNQKVFGGKKRYATNDEEYLLAVYCTNARVDKGIFKLIDEGDRLEMQLMHKLPNMVYKDIWEEHGLEIYNMKNRTINFGKFKQMVTKRCLEILKQSIENNAINKNDKQ